MINKDNLLHCFVACLTLVLIIIAVACSPVEPIEITRDTLVITATATVESVTKEIEAAPSLIVSVPTARPTIFPSPSPIYTSTPITITSSLQKSGELPWGSFPYPSMGISADGALLAISAAGNEDALYVFDMITQTLKWTIVGDDTGGTTGYSSLTFSPDGRYLAGWDNGYSLFVWGMENGGVFYQMEFERDWNVYVQSVSFSPDGQLLALSSLNGVFIYDMETGELIDEFPSSSIVTYPPTDGGDHFLKPSHPFGEIWEVAFIPNYDNLLALTIATHPLVEGEGIAGGLYFWDMKAQKLEIIITGKGGFQMLVSPNGQFLVVIIDRKLVGWDIPNNRETFTIESIEDSGSLVAIVDTGFFVTKSSSAGLKVWDFDGYLVAKLQSDRLIRDAVFTPEGQLLIAYGGENSSIEVWELHE
jgi:WD40 repeat protein